MVQVVSTPQPLTRASARTNRLARILVAGGSGLAALLLVAALILWARYGTTMFFEMIASGFASCF
jgi:hypothetical protein